MRRGLGVLAGAVLATAVLAGCAPAAPAEAPLRVAVIGDQYSAGASSPGWPRLFVDAMAEQGVEVSLTTDAVDGSGYLVGESDSVRDRMQRLPDDTEVVVVALGAVDAKSGADDSIRRGAVVEALTAADPDTLVIALSPIAADPALAEGAAAWDATITAAAAETGARYVALDVPADGSGLVSGGRLSSVVEGDIAARVAQAARVR